LASHQLRAFFRFGLACVAVFRVLGRLSRLARAVAARIFMLHDARGLSQRGFFRQRFVLRTQATSYPALPGIQSSAIVQFTDGVACCRLTRHSSGRLRRRLIPALGSKMSQSPLEEISDHAFARLEATGGDPDALPIAVKTLIVVYSAQGIIDNGGLEYFYESNFPLEPTYSTFSSAYISVGALSAAECIEMSAGMFPFPNPHLSQQLRRDFLAQLTPEHPFTRLSDRICGDESVWEKLEEYAVTHRAEIVAA
jgi:hypothetical protein